MESMWNQTLQVWQGRIFLGSVLHPEKKLQKNQYELLTVVQQVLKSGNFLKHLNVNIDA